MTVCCASSDKTMLMVFNKIDRLADRSILPMLGEKYANRVFISATRGINILGFKEEVLRLLQKEFVDEEFILPQSEQRLVSQLYDAGEVLERVYEEDKVRLRIRVKRKDVERIKQIAQGHPKNETRNPKKR